MLSKGVSNWACYLVTHKYAWSVCINLREKPSLSLGNQTIPHIRKGTVSPSSHQYSGPLGEQCLGK